MNKLVVAAAGVNLFLGGESSGITNWYMKSVVKSTRHFYVPILFFYFAEMCENNRVEVRDVICLPTCLIEILDIHTTTSRKMYHDSNTAIYAEKDLRIIPLDNFVYWLLMFYVHLLLFYIVVLFTFIYLVWIWFENIIILYIRPYYIDFLLCCFVIFVIMYYFNFL